MMRLVETAEWTASTRALVREIREGGQHALRMRSCRERLVSRILSELDGALHVYVPSGPDQAERVLLGLARALGPELSEEVGAFLSEASDDVTPALGAIDRQLEGRPLVVVGWDDLSSASGGRELGRAIEPRIRSVKRWLAEHRGLFVGRVSIPTGAPQRVRARGLTSSGSRLRSAS